MLRFCWAFKLILLFILLSAGRSAFAQKDITGTVKDSKTKEPLAFCSIGISGTRYGGLCNVEGEFRITVTRESDTLVFSYLGYQTVKMTASQLALHKVIYLERKEILLKEFVVHADNDFLWDILSKCRKYLRRNHVPQVCKLYYGLESQSGNEPVEMLECYYNACLNGTTIDSLLLKNGRVALAQQEQHYFLSLNTSKAVTALNIAEGNDQWPALPTNLSSRQGKRDFRLWLAYSDDAMYKINFESIDSIQTQSSGTLWIDSQTFAPLKTKISLHHVRSHPFMPMFPFDSIKNLDLEVNQTYQSVGGYSVPEHLEFSYKFTYKSNRDTLRLGQPAHLEREVTTHGILYFYDYDQPFLLPYFTYAPDFDDYRKISLIPYNADFWKNNNALLLTNRQKEELGFLMQKGQLVNYTEGNYGKDFLNICRDKGSVFEYYYCFWKPGERIILNRKLEQNKVFPIEKINRMILSDLYRLKVQILLDINPEGDHFQSRSYTVFDAMSTFFHLPEQPYTSAFLNIYFDLWEIERRKMQAELDSSNFSLDQIRTLYQAAVHRAGEITERYLKEVKTGKEEKALKKWNRLVIKEIQVDRMKEQ